MRFAIPRSLVARAAIVVAAAAGLGALVWWRGPEWGAVADAFSVVRWEWVVTAIALNLLSVIVRALAWRTVIGQAMPPPHPGVPLVFSAFSVGLFANAVLPGRIGELARVRVVRVRSRERTPPQPVGAGGPGADPAAGRDEPLRARRAARAGSCRARCRLPVPRLAVPVLRGVRGDARVRHPFAAAGGRARPVAHERGDALPALAREHRPPPGCGG